MDISYCWNCWSPSHSHHNCKDEHRSIDEREELRISKRIFSKSWSQYMARMGRKAAIIQVENCAPDDRIYKIQQLALLAPAKRRGPYSERNSSVVYTPGYSGNSARCSSSSETEAAQHPNADEAHSSDADSEASSEVESEVQVTPLLELEPESPQPRYTDSIVEKPLEDLVPNSFLETKSSTMSPRPTGEIQEIFNSSESIEMDRSSAASGETSLLSQENDLVLIQGEPEAKYTSIFNSSHTADLLWLELGPTGQSDDSFKEESASHHELLGINMQMQPNIEEFNQTNRTKEKSSVSSSDIECLLTPNAPSSSASSGEETCRSSSSNGLSGISGTINNDTTVLRQLRTLTPPPVNGKFIFMGCYTAEEQYQNEESRRGQRNAPRISSSPTTPTRRRWGSGRANRTVRRPHSSFSEWISILPPELLHSIIQYVALQGIYEDPRLEPSAEERSRHEKIRARNLRNVRLVNKQWYEVSQKMIYSFVNFASLGELAKFARSLSYSRTMVAQFVLGLCIDVKQLEPHDDWRKYMRPRNQFEKPERQLEKDIETSRVTKLMRTIFDRCTNLREFIAKCDGAIRFFDGLDAQYPSITKVHLYDGLDKGRCAQNTWKVIQRCPNLQNFSLVRPETNRLFDYKAMEIVPIREVFLNFNFNRLTSLHFEFAAEVSDKILSHICGQLPELKKLHINECKLVTASGLAKVVDGMRQRITEFSYTSHIDTLGHTTEEEARQPECHLCKILNGCPFLEILYFAPYRCCRELFGDVRWPNLRVLKIDMVEYHGCHGEQDDSTLQAAFEELISSGKCPLIIPMYLKYQTNTPGVIYQR